MYADQLVGAKNDFEVVALANINITDDVEAALAPVKMMLAFYIGGMGAKGQNFHTELAEDLDARTAGVERMRPFVEAEAVPLDGVGAAALMAPGLDQHHVSTPQGRGGRGGESRQAASDHDHVGCVHLVASSVAPSPSQTRQLRGM